MISTTANYALRATVFLASKHGEYVRRSTIANATQVPEDYLLKVLGELDAAGIVTSRRGPGGGYCLTAAPDQITALDVALVVDEIPRIKECPFGISSHSTLCPLHQLLDDASRKVESAFGSVNLSDLVPMQKKARTCCFPTTTSIPLA